MQKPVDIIEQMILASSDEGMVVLDPFAGTGSTLLAAKNTNRKYVGIEISEKYCEIARQRLKQDLLL
jgi:site-specific DNA-methyltransferase (adenine-specific)